ncbi:MAG: hypothetical protein RLZZ573_1810, partial [Pseudomonadota bacterium]
MNDTDTTITAAQLATLNTLIANNDRVGFYVKLNEYTGSTTALVMAQISSSSGFIGGAAWAINNAYNLVVPGYPAGGVTEFSKDIAQADYDLIELSNNGSGLFTVPNDRAMLEGAYTVWKEKSLGIYFPGNGLIALNGLREGGIKGTKKAAEFGAYAAATALITGGLGVGDAWSELFDSRWNSGQSMQEFLDENPGSHVVTSPDGKVQSIVGADGKTLGAFTDSLLDAIPISYVQELRNLITNASSNVAQLWATLDGFASLDLQNGLRIIAPAANTLFLQARNWTTPRDPLVLDLDGDGIETLAINPAAPILFDMDADGVKTGTGWIKPDDALVVLDRNGNGLIDSGSELFGDSTVLQNGPKAGQKAANGFEALADLDANADGVMNNLDAAYASLRLWQDANQDGVSQATELTTFAEQGIASINVVGTPGNVDLGGGNTQVLAGSFTRTSGQSGTTGVADLAGSLLLAGNGFYREFTDDPVVTSAAAALPQMTGAGWVRDLREAMSLGTAQAAALQARLTEYSAATTREAQLALLDGLLGDWARTSGRLVDATGHYDLV